MGHSKKWRDYTESNAWQTDPAHQYIQSFSLNGKPLQRAWFHHSNIADGGKLVFSMGPEPSPAFGSEVSAVPPSLSLA
jgi:putative alpha-1,2-mannosidase